MKNDFTQLSDIELYTLLNEKQNLKEQAFAEIYSRYSKRIYLYCRRILGNRDSADDIFQETFLNFLKSVSKDRVMTNLPAYLLRIARNLCLKAKREQKILFVPLDEFQMSFDDNQLEKKEITELVSRALELLPDEYREALVLQTYNGMSYAEIGEFLDVPVTTVRNWIVRAKKKVSEILSHYFENRTA